MSPTAQVIDSLERLTALADLTAADIGRVLSVVVAPDPSTTNPFYRGYVARPERSVYTLVEFREPVPGSAAPGARKILTLTAGPDTAVARRDLEARFGPRPPSQIIPEGLQSFSYAMGRYAVHLTYRTPSMTLHHVALQAPVPA
jgi:hypothetical protein